jgi:uncharacterized protein (UPF0548 family)
MLLDRLLGQPADTHAALEELRGKDVNFDLAGRAGFTPENGWHVDDVRQRLPPEPPGPPLPDGSWDAACRIARNYDFAEPSRVEGIFERAEPLENRTMLLVLHFHGLRIHSGVRVGDVYEETRALEGREGRVWGWNYRTLEGHVERGQMDWQVWKWPDTGEVMFRISSFAQAADGRNLLVRVGFRLFGRREQLRFLRMTARRMAWLTEERMRDRRPQARSQM